MHVHFLLSVTKTTSCSASDHKNHALETFLRPSQEEASKAVAYAKHSIHTKEKKKTCAKQEGQEGSDSELPEKYFLANVNKKESQAFLDFVATGYLR